MELTIVGFYLIACLYRVRAEDYSKVNLSQYPSYVHLDIEMSGIYTYCGGSYVDNYWVLTAAHCLDLNRRGATYLGDHGRVNLIMGTSNYQDSESVTRQRRKSIKLAVHPRYYSIRKRDDDIEDGERKHYDLGMIKMDRPFEIGELVRVGTIATSIVKNQRFVAFSYVFDEVELTECDVSDSLIYCKGGDFERIDGAPLYSSGKKQIVGVVGGNKATQYSVNVVIFRDWIEKMTKRKLATYTPILDDGDDRRRFVGVDDVSKAGKRIVFEIWPAFYGFVVIHLRE